MASCSKSKNPEKCKAMVDKNMAKEKVKLQKQKAKLQALVLKGRGYSGEPGDIVTTRT
jgi:hypothetical protein